MRNMIRTSALVLGTWAVLGAMALGLTSDSHPSQAPSVAVQAPDGQIGSATLAQLVSPVSSTPDTLAEVLWTDSPCQATLDQVTTMMPMDLGTVYGFAELSQAGGLYFPTTGTVAVQASMPCEFVGVVVAHEWSHHLQEVRGLNDRVTSVNGVERSEIVAECSARDIAAGYDWPTYDGYPEQAGVSCDQFVIDIAALR